MSYETLKHQSQRKKVVFKGQTFKNTSDQLVVGEQMLIYYSMFNVMNWIKEKKNVSDREKNKK